MTGGHVEGDGAVLVGYEPVVVALAEAEGGAPAHVDRRSLCGEAANGVDAVAEGDVIVDG